MTRIQIITIVVVLTAILIWFAFPTSGQRWNDNDHKSDDPTPRMRDPAPAHSEPPVPPALVSPSDSGSSSVGVPDDINREWMASRGYGSVELHWYKVDDQFAETQASAGDIGAQKYLAWKTMASDTGASMHWLREASLNGSTFAFIQMAERSKLIAEGKLSNPWSQETGTAEFRILSVAYPLVGQLRGDHVTAPQVTSRNLQYFNLSDEDQNAACSLAKQVFKELSAERMVRGLGEFDNSPPPLSTDPPNLDDICSPAS